MHHLKRRSALAFGLALAAHGGILAAPSALAQGTNPIASFIALAASGGASNLGSLLSQQIASWQSSGQNVSQQIAAMVALAGVPGAGGSANTISNLAPALSQAVVGHPAAAAQVGQGVGAAAVALAANGQGASTTALLSAATAPGSSLPAASMQSGMTAQLGSQPQIAGQPAPGAALTAAAAGTGASGLASGAAAAASGPGGAAQQGASGGLTVGTGNSFPTTNQGVISNSPN